MMSPDINNPKYGALITDEFDAGQVIGEDIARQIFERQDREYGRKSAPSAALKTATGTT